MPLSLNAVTLEIGSTITKSNGFVLEEGIFKHVAQGFAPTTVSDVSEGLLEAINSMEEAGNCSSDGAQAYISSSAAGGLRVTVHGLTYNMTARAAKEASLGAGANIKLITAGALSEYDLEEIEEINPNMIILAGGVDFGAREPVLDNAVRLASLDLQIPVIYCGNVALKRPLTKIFQNSLKDFSFVDNVFPDVDVLNVEPLRRKIQEVFSKHIVHAKGMEKVTRITNKPVLPVPAVVLKAAEIIYEAAGDVAIIDVGGATTDVHSVTEGSPKYADMLIEPEPFSKRTVEGDLGVFVNAANVADLVKTKEKPDLNFLRALPDTENEKNLTASLCSTAVYTAIRRHAAVVSDLYTPTGRKQTIKGKDLSEVKYIIATGGALTRIPGGEEIIKKSCVDNSGKYLLPSQAAKILLDKNYLLSSLGLLSFEYPEEIKNTIKKWIGIKNE